MVEQSIRKREAGDTVGGIFEVIARGVVPVRRWFTTLPGI